ncbi:SDR family NAD(P)-dependent oxidoreductase [Litorivivens sp.]
MQDFTGKTVVITGAGSGMGRAYAKAFAALGCKVALCDVDREALAETQRLIRADHCLFMHVDVADANEVLEFSQRVEAELGPAHIVINNAGIEGSAQPSWKTSLDTYRRVMEVNYFGVVHGTRAFLAQLQSHDESWLVNVSSIFGLIGTPNHTDYCGSKFAVRGYTEALMCELKGSPVNVLLAHPGGIATNIARHDFNQRFAQHYLTTSPEAFVEALIAAIRKKRHRLVFGAGSRKSALAARLLPLGILSSVIWREMKNIIDTRHYPNK